MQIHTKCLPVLAALAVVVAIVANVRADSVQNEKSRGSQQTTAEKFAPAADSAELDDEDAEDFASVDWVEEAKKGGNTMIVLGLLSVAALAFFIERCFSLRINLFAPRRLHTQLATLIEKKEMSKLRELCQHENSTLGKVGLFIAQHHDRSHELVTEAIADIAGRDIRNQIAKTAPLSVIAGLAPLLGLLGTMIGMIEAFKLVAVYGDDGGAAMLAGSIAKALITTAGGLILAIPTLGAYHYFRHGINSIANEVEIQLDRLVAAMLFDKSHPAHSTEPAVADSTKSDQKPALMPTTATGN